MTSYVYISALDQFQKIDYRNLRTLEVLYRSTFSDTMVAPSLSPQISISLLELRHGRRGAL